MQEHFKITKHLIQSENFLAYISAITKDLISIDELGQVDEEHLKQSINWLLMSADVTDGNGFSASYGLKTGWDEAYPETTGYIIPTLLNSAYADYRKEEIEKKCFSSGEWLLKIQNPDGSWNGHGSSNGFVFDTGQIIFGLLALYIYFSDERYLQSAERAATWIISMQENNGSWVRGAYQQKPHTYYSRVAWALLVLWKFTKKEKYLESSQKNFSWVLSRQDEEGWFKDSGFYENKPVVLHTIAYTLEGLLGAWEVLGEETYLVSAERSINGLISGRETSILPGYYKEHWRSVGGGKCLTGIAQIGIVLKKLYAATKKEKYLDYANKLEQYLKKRNRKVKFLPRALSGSDPVWGRYLPYLYPNWAQKFFIDLLLLNTNSKNRNFSG